MIQEMARQGASDLLLIPGASPTLRVDGSLKFWPAETVTQERVVELLEPFLHETKKSALAGAGSIDFSLRLELSTERSGKGMSICRVRVNLQRQRGELAAALRLLPSRVPSVSELNLPPVMETFTQSRSGLILVCGPTGAGKTSTLAAMIDQINRTRRQHIITIEDPIEYEHTNHQSLVEQVEIGSDAVSFARALRSALRRDPDVILVGEMRDLETMSTAVTAAETGHLILSTLHTGDTTQAVHRIVDVFPSEQQQQVRHQLALSLSAIVAQQLIPRIGGKGRVPAVEILVATHAVRHHVRCGALERIYNEVHGGQRLGMMTLERSLADLVKQGEIEVDQALQRAPRPDELKRML
ncbi:MAG: PilT/PilU family type 4a pilus ATPase [bacterium]|nr:PilT/PilU family type 4a pilus ATPase [bacterium]